MSTSIDGRVVVVTGLSQGIGKSIAKDFAMAGYHVLVNSLNEEELKNTVANIESQIGNNSRISYLVGDISVQGFAETLMEEAMGKFGRIDVLVNNAKVTNDPKKMDECNTLPNNTSQQEQQLSYFVPEEYQMSDPKVKGIFYCIKAAVNKMLAMNGGNFAIINISSCQGCMTQRSANEFTQINFGIDPYADSMASIETITKTIALELADKGIRVNGIIPGLVSDDINEEIIKDSKKRNDTENDIPIKRIAQPEEVSKVALFLASNDASYITGAMIPVDGGLMLTRPNYFLEVR